MGEVRAIGLDFSNTTNAIEGLNRGIRNSVRTRGSFPTGEAATKPIRLAIRKFEKDGQRMSGKVLPPATGSPRCSARGSTPAYLKPHGPGQMDKVQDAPRTGRGSSGAGARTYL